MRVKNRQQLLRLPTNSLVHFARPALDLRAVPLGRFPFQVLVAVLLGRFVRQFLVR
jgi:hypothetical protein